MGQHVDGRTARRKATLERLMECHDNRERLMECHDDRKRRTAQALDKPRHHTAKDGVYGARGARLTLSQTATPEKVSKAQDSRLGEKNRWMILMKRSQKSGPTAGRRADPQRVRRADLQLVKEHSQLQARQKSIANCRHEPRRIKSTTTRRTTWRWRLEETQDW